MEPITPLHIGSLPRRSRRGQHFLDAQVSHLFFGSPSRRLHRGHEAGNAGAGHRERPPAVATPSTRRSGERLHGSEECDDDHGPTPETRKARATARRDVDADFEQLTVDGRCTPTRILPAHLADQISDLARNGRSSGLAAPHLPGPEQPKTGTMPGHDRFGPDDG